MKTLTLAAALFVISNVLAAYSCDAETWLVVNPALMQAAMILLIPTKVLAMIGLIGLTDER